MIMWSIAFVAFFVPRFGLFATGFIGCIVLLRDVITHRLKINIFAD